MVSVSGFKSSSIQHDVHFVNYDPIYFKIDNKAGYAIGRGYMLMGITDATDTNQVLVLAASLALAQ